MNTLKPQEAPNTITIMKWNNQIDWMIDSTQYDCPHVTFYRNHAPILKIEVDQKYIHFLKSASKDNKVAFPFSNPEDTYLNQLLTLLRERKILIDLPPYQARIRIFTQNQILAHSWITSSDCPMDIDILAGDEWTLVSEYPQFIQQCPDKHLIATLRLTPDLLDLGPVRFAREVEPPKNRDTIPHLYPRWRDRLKYALGLIEEIFESGFVGPVWYALTSRGFRMKWQWQESRTPYIVETSPVVPPKDCISLFYFQANVEGGLLSGGSGESAAAASFAATCEAWERFCMDRPDLAISVSSEDLLCISEQPGVYFDYLRSLSKPMRAGPTHCLGCQIRGPLKYKIPSEWIYFNGAFSVANTNGAAFGSTLEDAIQSAILEVVERHALIKVYFGISSGYELASLELGEELLLFKKLKLKNRRVNWYHIGKWKDVQIVVCVLSSQSPPYASVGVAARSSLQEAAKKAIFEASSVEILWAQEIEKLGLEGFICKGKEILLRPSDKVELLESGWVWAGMRAAGEKLAQIFDSQTQFVLKSEEPKVVDLSVELDETKFIAVDIGKHILNSGSVVKVIHPDALPLPSSFAHAQKLAELLNTSIFLPVPMT